MADTKYTSNPDIPYGYCQCGCGQKTTLARKTSTRDGTIKGQPNLFLDHHRTCITENYFASRVDKSGGEDACWLWTGKRLKSGYGRITWHGHQVYSHRLAYQLAYGDFDQLLEVCHSCDTPSCCNPKHLFLGTHQENIDDCTAKKRNAFGERQGRRKLNWEQVREIRRLRNQEHSRLAHLAQRFGVTPGTIRYVVENVTWKE